MEPPLTAVGEEVFGYLRRGSPACFRMILEVADEESEGRSLRPSITPPKPRIDTMREADPGPRVSAEAAGYSAWEDFRGAGAALRGVNRCERVGFRPGAGYMRVADNESFENSSSSLGVSPAVALLNLPTLHITHAALGTPLSVTSCRKMSLACCPFLHLP